MTSSPFSHLAQEPLTCQGPIDDAVFDHPLALLGGDSKFSRGVRIGLTPNEENLFSSVIEDELLSTSIELHCRGMVLARLAAYSRNRKFEEISRLEHELSEASSSLKSTLNQVSANELRVVQDKAELELSKARYVNGLAEG